MVLKRGKAQNFLLTTKLFCGLCGSPMIGDGGTSHTGKAYAYYSCTKRKRGRSCKKESVPKDWIEDLVVGELVKIVHNDELIEQIADRVMEYQKREKIIPYQEIIGNYSLLLDISTRCQIIPYQEITGNYSCQGWYGILESLSIPQNKKIPLLRII